MSFTSNVSYKESEGETTIVRYYEDGSSVIIKKSINTCAIRGRVVNASEETNEKEKLSMSIVDRPPTAAKKEISTNVSDPNARQRFISRNTHFGLAL